MAFMPHIHAATIVDSGEWGAQGGNVTWTLDSDGKLTFSGTGEMKDYVFNPSVSNSLPWKFCDVKLAVIENGITSIGDYAFWSCSSLTSVTIPDSITRIGAYAFYICSNLTNITIPNSVTDIDYRAFGRCSSLTSITIPDSVTNIIDGGWVFSECSSLTSIEVDPNNNTYSSKEGVLFDKNKTELICYPCSKTGSYIIPDSVTDIGELAFYECSSLTSLTIPKSVTSISFCAFADCDSLTDVYYSGTKEEWNAIEIDYTNTSLSKATIHYNSSGISTPSILDTTTVTKTGVDYLFDVKLQDVPYNCELITALYKNGEMTGIKTTDITSADTEKAVTVTAESADSAKIFIWNSTSSIKPLCEAKNIIF